MGFENGDGPLSLKNLVHKKVQINYINSAQEEDTAAGRLLKVTNDQIIIEGALMTQVLYRRQIKIISIDVRDEPEGDTMNLFIKLRRGKPRITVHDWTKIGEQINKGKKQGRNSPKGIDWELSAWFPIENKGNTHGSPQTERS